jgi:hypothetical protein
MSTATARAYRSRFTGRIAPAGSRKSPESKPFCGRRSPYSRQVHCIKDRVLLDDTCSTDDFLINTNNDRIVKVERGNAKYMEVNA